MEGGPYSGIHKSSLTSAKQKWMRTIAVLDLPSMLLLAQCAVYLTMNYGSTKHDSTNSPQPRGAFIARLLLSQYPFCTNAGVTLP